MAVKIRLARHGRKNKPFYHIIVADSRSPRDGKFIEKLGTYNPMTNPCTAEVNFDRSLYWLEVGAQPTDAVKSILSHEGLLLMKHLNGGVRKGAFDQATADAKFQSWLETKREQNQTAAEKLVSDAAKDAAARLEAEKKVSADRAERIAKRNSDLIAAAVAETQVDVADEAEAPAEESAE